MILRTTYTGTGGSVVEDERFYPIQSWAQNWRADVSVVLDDAGVQQERVIYSPYGQPFAMPAGDTNFDGDFEAGVDGDELADWDINGVPYRAYADVNLDGDIDGDDATAASEHDLGWNVLTSDGDGASGVNNRLGYAGYIHDRDVATAAHVRYRVYKIDLGRWVQRDPLGYVDGLSLYAYVSSRPVRSRDPSGLACTDLVVDFGCGSGQQPAPQPAPGPAAPPPVPAGCAGTITPADMADPLVRIAWGRAVAACGGAPTITCGPCTPPGPCGKATCSGRVPSITICTNPGAGCAALPMREIIAHELIHAAQCCTTGFRRGCDNVLCDELEAYVFSGACVGSPRGYRNCLCQRACLSAGTACSSGCVLKCLGMLASGACPTVIVFPSPGPMIPPPPPPPVIIVGDSTSSD